MMRLLFRSFFMAGLALATHWAPGESDAPAIDATIKGLQSNTIEDFDFGLPGLYGLGSEEAPLVLLEFSDYECTTCAAFHEMVYPKIKSEYIDTGKLYYVALNHPQPNHATAQIAAEASYAAGLQGRFWDMRALLFANSLYLSAQAIADLADALELDRESFDAVMVRTQFQEQVLAERACAGRMGVGGTPSFILATKAGNHARAGTLLPAGLLWSGIDREISKRLQREVEPPSSP